MQSGATRKSIIGRWNIRKKKTKKAHNQLDGTTDTTQGINNTLRELLGNDFPRSEGKTEKSTQYEVSKKLVSKFDRGVSTEQFIEELVPVAIRYSLHIDCKVTQNGWRPFFLRAFLHSSNRLLRHNKELDFHVSHTDCPKPYEIWWKVRNVGPEAIRRNMIRGQIDKTNRDEHHEHTNFEGQHYVECYLIQNGVCVARDHIDVPIGTL